MQRIDTRREYGFEVGDRVSHRREPDSLGTVRHIDTNLSDITTIQVEWDDSTGALDIQWSNKLVLAP